MDADGWYYLSDNVADRYSVREELIHTKASLCTRLMDPRRRPFRYLLLIFPLIFMEFVFSYCIDIPAGIQSTIIRVMHIDGTQYGVIYSTTRWPDIFTAVVGLVVVNKLLGTYRGFIVYSTITFIGQLICSIGAFANNYWTVVFGRFVIGCTYGTNLSIFNVFYIRWFGNMEIAFVVSLARCMCRLGATLALNIPELMYQSLSRFDNPSFQHGITQMFGTFLCVLAIGCAVTVVIMDRHGAALAGVESQLNGTKQNKRSFFNFRQVLKLPPTFWCLVAILTSFYAVPLAFTGYGALFFTNKYQLPLFLANLANSLSYTSITLFTPFIGILIDITGYNLSWGGLGVLLAMTANVIYIAGENWQQFMAFIGSVLYSFAYSFVGSSIWILPGILVSSDLSMTAYCIVASVLAFDISLFSLLSGYIVDYYGYFILILGYALVVFVIACLTIYLVLSDFLAENPVMNISSKQRRMQTKHTK